jgi:hypothetical protein
MPKVRQPRRKLTSVVNWGIPDHVASHNYQSWHWRHLDKAREYQSGPSSNGATPTSGANLRGAQRIYCNCGSDTSASADGKFPKCSKLRVVDHVE